jgi:hypothetical protein
MRKLWLEKAPKLNESDASWICSLKNLESFSAPDSKFHYNTVSHMVHSLPKLRELGIKFKAWSKDDFTRLKKEFPKLATTNDNRAD